jgi:hypothetical protein
MPSLLHANFTSQGHQRGRNTPTVLTARICAARCGCQLIALRVPAVSFNLRNPGFAPTHPMAFFISPLDQFRFS